MEPSWSEADETGVTLAFMIVSHICADGRSTKGSEGFLG
jgi:hypothetical protein